MAMELLVVATDEVGLPECVREPGGRLVPPGDPDALRAALEEVLALPLDERAAAGAAGRAWVLEHANVQRETERLADLIAEVAS
jgi:glycosyltransferase involved in cell wall biosynthesis